MLKRKLSLNDIGLTEGFDIEVICITVMMMTEWIQWPLYYQYFSDLLNELPVYKNARPTLSILTITSNVMYGKKQVLLPDGRSKGVAFAPVLIRCMDVMRRGAIASLSSVSKINYDDAQDGVSNTSHCSTFFRLPEHSA